MRTNQLARRRGLRAVARLAVIAGAVGVAALVGAQPAGATATPVSAQGAQLQEDPDATAAEANEPGDDDPPPGGGGQEPGNPDDPDPNDPDPNDPDPNDPDPNDPDVPGGGNNGPGENPPPAQPGPGAGSGGGNNNGNNNGGSRNNGSSNNNGGGGGSSSGGSVLAVTGTNVAIVAGLGAAMTAAGVGLILVTRRRRVTPTA